MIFGSRNISAYRILNQMKDRIVRISIFFMGRVLQEWKTSGIFDDKHSAPHNIDSESDQD
jgi:hypothetical protein